MFFQEIHASTVTVCVERLSAHGAIANDIIASLIPRKGSVEKRRLNPAYFIDGSAVRERIRPIDVLTSVTERDVNCTPCTDRSTKKTQLHPSATMIHAF